MANYLANPFTTTFNVDFSKGNTLVTFIGDIPHDAKKFNISLTDQNKKGIILTPDFTKGQVEIFSQQGQSPIQNVKFSLTPGDSFEIMVLLEDNEFEVALNGELIARARHSVPAQELTNVTVDGDVQLIGVNFFYETADNDDTNNFATSNPPFKTQGGSSLDGHIVPTRAQDVKADYANRNAQPLSTNHNNAPVDEFIIPTKVIKVNSQQSQSRGGPPPRPAQPPVIGFNIPRDISQPDAFTSSPYSNSHINNVNTLGEASINTTGAGVSHAGYSATTGGYDYHDDYYGSSGAGRASPAGGQNVEPWRDPLAGGAGNSLAPNYQPNPPPQQPPQYGYGTPAGYNAGYITSPGGDYNQVPVQQRFPGRKSKFNFQGGDGMMGAAATAIGAYAINKLIANRNNMEHGGGFGGLTNMFTGRNDVPGGRGSGNQLADLILGAVGSAAGSKIGYDVTRQIPGAQTLQRGGMPTGMIGSFIGSILGNRFVRG